MNGQGRGLRALLLWWILPPASLALIGVGIWNMAEASRVLAEDEARTIQRVRQRLESAVPPLVRDLEATAIARLIAGEAADPHLARIAVLLDGRVLAEVGKAGGEAPLSIPLAVDPGSSASIELTPDPAPRRQAVLHVAFSSLAGVVGANLLIAVAISMAVARLVRPVAALARASQAMAAGDLSAPLPEAGSLEVRRLAAAFDGMRNAIRRNLAELDERNRDLDRRVQERTAELERLHQELVQAATAAGKAEMATGVLHNIGNVLVGAVVDLDGLRGGGEAALAERAGRLAELLASQGDLARFIRDDPRGPQFQRYLTLFLEEVVAVQQGNAARISRLERQIGLIRDTVQMQQAWARGTASRQAVDLAAEVEGILTLHAGGISRRAVAVEKRLATLPPVVADRPRVAHILANLVKNALEAMEGAPPERRILTVALAAADGHAELTVADRGHGIDPTQRERLFAFGFTTKTHGHGFGLHSCAIAMHEMGGTITVDSPGIGLGATATLRFPLGRTEAAA